MMDGRTLNEPHHTPLEEFEAALDWWREAGVDHDFMDEPNAWLADGDAGDSVTAPPPPPPPPARPPQLSPMERALAQTGAGERIGGESATWPATLEDFRAWWLSEPTLADADVTRRLPPRGVARARLMVLVDQPARDDGDSLLSGGTGKLLVAMLRAMGIAEHEAYLASALPAASALPDWNGLADRRLGDVLRHHVALVRPERVLVIGREMAPLFDIAPEQARDPAILAIEGGSLPMLLAPDFAQLARLPARRRNFWNRWLDWTQ